MNIKGVFSALLIAAIVIQPASAQIPSPVIKGIVSIGPLEASLNIGMDGKVSVSAGLNFKDIEIFCAAGICLKAGIGAEQAVDIASLFKQTVNLTDSHPYYLYLLFYDQKGNLTRTSFEIGKPFSIRFNDNTWIRRIEGNNNSVVVVVEARGDVGQTIVVTATPISGPCGGRKWFFTPAPGLSLQEFREASVQLQVFQNGRALFLPQAGQTWVLFTDGTWTNIAGSIEIASKSFTSKLGNKVGKLASYRAQMGHTVNGNIVTAYATTPDKQIMQWSIFSNSMQPIEWSIIDNATYIGCG